MGIIRINPEESSGAACKCVCTLANDFPSGIFSTSQSSKMVWSSLAVLLKYTF